ncbi:MULTISPECIES: hypothetical protein [unclassified Clostridium]|uniref:hypothetical protein n=1 Tax=unclassified Clostridium TaxID=2614128 RepID=UPI00207A16E7|nr:MULTISPECIES: hypothetical protein [unclassified Clostridium]
MKDLFKAIEEKCKHRDKLKKQLKENKYPKTVYKKNLKQLNEMQVFFCKYGRDVY